MKSIYISDGHYFKDTSGDILLFRKIQFHFIICVIVCTLTDVLSLFWNTSITCLYH